MVHAQPSIVVVDDEPDLRAILRDILTEEGHRVATFASVEDLMAAMPSLAPDVLILDIGLARPGSGLDLLASVKTDPLTTGVPILVCTGAVHLEDDILALLEPQDGYIRKPFDLDILLDEVNRCLGCVPSRVHAA